MGAYLVLRIFIFTIVSKLCAGHNGSISHFRVLRKHKHINECANFIMSDKNGYSGGRVSDKTGECEGLPYSSKRNQPIEAEYGYFRQISTQKSFVPPIDVREDGYSLAFPGTFDTGARLELNVTMFEKKTHKINITITEVTNSHRGFQLWLDSSGNNMFFNEIPDELDLDDSDTRLRFPDSFYQSTNPIQISFVAQKNSIQLLVDDQTVVTKESKNVRLDLLTHFALSSGRPHALFLHRFLFR